jgi:maltose-binding protein MalE
MTTPPQFSRRALLAGAGGLSVAAFLAACTAGGTGSGGSGGANQKLTLWMDSAFTAAMKKTVSGFSGKYGVTLEVQPKDYGTILANFQQAAPTGSGPDLLDVNIDFIGPLTDAKLVQALDFGSRLKDLDKRAITGYTVDGKVYGLPLAVEATNFWRNPTVVDSPVATWDDLAELGAGLKAKGIKYPFLMDVNAYVFQGMLTAYGSYVFKQKADGSYDPNDVGIDDSGAIAALQFFADAVKNGWLGYVGAADNSGLTAATAGDAWKAGQVGVHFSGPWMLDTYTKAGKFEIDKIPAGPAGPAVSWLSARGLVVNSNSKNAALASTFLTDYLTADGPMSTWAKTTAKLSAWTPVQKSAANATTAAFGAAAPNAQPIPQNAELAGFWTPMTDGLTLILEGKSSPGDVAANAAQKFRDSIKAAQK